MCKQNANRKVNIGDGMMKGGNGDNTFARFSSKNQMCILYNSIFDGRVTSARWKRLPIFGGSAEKDDRKRKTNTESIWRYSVSSFVFMSDSDASKHQMILVRKPYVCDDSTNRYGITILRRTIRAVPPGVHIPNVSRAAHVILRYFLLYPHFHCGTETHRHCHIGSNLV